MAACRSSGDIQLSFLCLGVSKIFTLCKACVSGVLNFPVKRSNVNLLSMNNPLQRRFIDLFCVLVYRFILASSYIYLHLLHVVEKLK